MSPVKLTDFTIIVYIFLSYGENTVLSDKDLAINNSDELVINPIDLGINSDESAKSHKDLEIINYSNSKINYKTIKDPDPTINANNFAKNDKDFGINDKDFASSRKDLSTYSENLRLNGNDLSINDKEIRNHKDISTSDDNIDSSENHSITNSNDLELTDIDNGDQIKINDNNLVTAAKKISISNQNLANDLATSNNDLSANDKNLVSSQNASSISKNIDDSKLETHSDDVLSRNKRFLIFPVQTLLQFSLCAVSPADIKRNIYVNAGFQLNWLLPNRTDQLPSTFFVVPPVITVGRAREKRDLDSEAYNNGDQQSEVYDKWDNDSKAKSNADQKREDREKRDQDIEAYSNRDQDSEAYTKRDQQSEVREKRDQENEAYNDAMYEEMIRTFNEVTTDQIYYVIETLLDNNGYNGTACLLHSICLISTIPLHQDGDLFHEILQFVLTPSEHSDIDTDSSNSIGRSSLKGYATARNPTPIQEYHRAESIGRSYEGDYSDNHCDLYYACPNSPLEKITHVIFDVL